jgi:hypothetical protein
LNCFHQVENNVSVLVLKALGLLDLRLFDAEQIAHLLVVQHTVGNADMGVVTEEKIHRWQWIFFVKSQQPYSIQMSKTHCTLSAS